MFSGNNFCTALASAALLNPTELAKIAFLSASLLTASTVISATVLLPYSLNNSTKQGTWRSHVLRSGYGTQCFFLVFLLTLAISIVCGVVLTAEFILPAMVYSALYLTRFFQRGFQIADQKNLLSFGLEMAGTVPMVLWLATSIWRNIPLNASDLVWMLSFLVAPVVIAGYIKSRMNITISSSVWRSFARQFRSKGSYSLSGVLPSEVLQNGHVYVLGAMNQLSLLATIYVASLFYRHLSILFNGLNVVQRTVFVRLIRRGEPLAAAKRAILSSAIGLCVVAANLALVISFMPNWIQFLSVSYDREVLLRWIILMGVFNALLAARLPLFTFQQARKKLRALAKAVFVAGASSASLWGLYLYAADDVLLAVLMIAPSALYSILVCIGFYSEYKIAVSEHIRRGS